MYKPAELADFTLAEFARGVADLTDAEARTRLAKQDGSQMNGISWIVAHIALHWINARSRALQEPRPTDLERFHFSPTDPTPPPLADALELLGIARQSTDWIANADAGLLALTLGQPGGRRAPENVGTYLMRAALHSWFHIGEINAIRQQLGHPEIAFVGPMAGKLEWYPEPHP